MLELEKLAVSVERSVKSFERVLQVQYLIAVQKEIDTVASALLPLRYIIMLL